MHYNLLPKWSELPSLFFEGDEGHFSPSNGLSLFEDARHVYVEASLPGLSQEAIDLSYHKGSLWVKAEKKEEKEDKEKKFYRKATSSFSYHVQLPVSVDESRQPEAVYKNGILRVTFHKKETSSPQKIAVKNG